MVRIIGGEFQTPEVTLQCFLTTRFILLGRKGLLVRTHLCEVLGAGRYRCGNRSEALTGQDLIRGYRSRALHFLTQVQAVTVRVGGSCFSARFLKKAAR